MTVTAQQGLFKIDWTEADLAGLPVDSYRYEIVDGRLYVTPPASESHQSMGTELLLALRSALPRGWRVRWDIGLRIGTDLLVPDLIVLPPNAPKAEAQFNDVTVITPALVVEIESRSTAAMDQGLKLVAYARGGISQYWRVTRDATMYLYRLGVDGYGTPTVLAPGRSTTIEFDSFPLTVTALRTDDQ